MKALTQLVKKVPADLLVLACGVVAAVHVGKLPPALPWLRSALGISLVEAGFLLSIIQLAGLSLALVLGLALSRVGLKRALVGGLSLLAVTSTMGSLASGANALLLARAVEGVGFLMVSLAAPALLRQLVAPQLLNLRMGWWGAYVPMGTSLALLLGPWVMQASGWPAWWLVLGGLAGLMTWMAWCKLGWESPAELAEARRAPSSSSQAPAALWRVALGRPGPWLVALCFAAYSSQWIAVIGFLPSIYADAGVSPPWIGPLSALAALTNMVGNIVAGRLLHAGRTPVSLLLTGFLTMGVAAFAAFGLPETFGGPVFRYLAVLVFSGVGGLIPGTLFATAVRVAGEPRAAAVVVGWTLQCSALGQFVGPPLAAWWTGQHGGWSQTWVTTSGAALLGIGLALGLSRVLRTSGQVPQ